MPPVIHHFDTPEAASVSLAEWTAQRLIAIVAEKGRAAIALPGGTTPKRFLELLAQKPIPWAQVTIMPTDERCVPLDHPRSNEGMLRRALTTSKPSNEWTFLSFVEAGTPIEFQAMRAAERVRQVAPIDLCICGMGDDMHTASLFPGDASWAAACNAQKTDPFAETVIATNPDGLEPRLSLSPFALCTAKQGVLLFSGASKLSAFERASNGTDIAKAPVRLLLSLNERCSVFMSL